MRLIEFGMVLTSLVFSSFGQVALQHGMNRVGSVGSVVRLFHALTTPYVILGLLLYVLGALFWLTVLSRVRELSLVYPMISLSYILVAVLSWWIFRDQITALRIAGILLICVGVACVGLSANSGVAAR